MFESEASYSEKEHQITYQEFMVPSFEKAVERVKESALIENNEGNFVVSMDNDGAYMEDNKVKIPIFCHTVEPIVTKKNRKAVESLRDSLTDGEVIMMTNRGKKNNILWNTGSVMGKVEESFKGIDVTVFQGLLKQAPWLKSGDTKKLISFLGDKLSDFKGKSVNFYSIEDLSIASPNRETHLTFLAKELKEKHDIALRITNYIIKQERGKVEELSEEREKKALKFSGETV